MMTFRNGFNEVMRLDSSGNLGIGVGTAQRLPVLNFDVWEQDGKYCVSAGDKEIVFVASYEEVEELFRIRFAEWKLERD
jgi:hypothetical protein